MKGEGFEPYREANGMQSALHGQHFSYSVTAGRGVMEIQIHPCQTLHELRERLTAAVERMKPAAERWKKHVLAYGGQPNTALTPECLTHKFHYFSLLRKIQEPYLFRGLQATNRFWVECDRTELLDILNWSHLLSPLVNTLSASTPIFAGEDGHYPSSRWQQQALLDEEILGDGRWQLVDQPYSGSMNGCFTFSTSPICYCEIQMDGSILEMDFWRVFGRHRRLTIRTLERCAGPHRYTMDPNTSRFAFRRFTPKAITSKLASNWRIQNNRVFLKSLPCLPYCLVCLKNVKPWNTGGKISFPTHAKRNLDCGPIRSWRRTLNTKKTSGCHLKNIGSDS